MESDDCLTGNIYILVGWKI